MSAATEPADLQGDGTRRRVLVRSPGVVDVVEEPLPRLLEGEALVKMTACGLCGSDKAGFHGVHAFMGPPYYPGHEVVGVVVALAQGTTGVSVGDRVTVQPTLPCGGCKHCLRGVDNLCENLSFFGCGYREGGMADVFSVPVSRLFRVPPDLEDYQAALIEPLATPLHAVRLAGDLRDKAVAIFGAGTIGLLTLVAARHAGARRVVTTDVLAAKRRLALEFGADAVVDAGAPRVADAVREELGESGDVVFDCVAHEQTLSEAVRVAIKGGTVLVVGGARAPVSLDLPRVQEYQVRLQGSTTYLREDFVEAVRLLRKLGSKAERLVTAAVPLSHAADAFSAADSGREVKILVTPK